MHLIYSSSGVVDRLTKLKVYVTVRAQDGSPTELTLPAGLAKTKKIRKGDFIEYRVFRTDSGLDHALTKIATPRLSDADLRRIEAEVADALD